MSWDAELSTEDGSHHREWNYTSNTSPMIHLALHDAGYPPQDHWYDPLDGHTGPQGGAFLHDIITELESYPEHYKRRFYSMDSEEWDAKEWGSYEGLLAVLRDMRDSVPEFPTVWAVSS